MVEGAGRVEEDDVRGQSRLSTRGRAAAGTWGRGSARPCRTPLLGGPERQAARLGQHYYRLVERRPCPHGERVHVVAREERLGGDQRRAQRQRSRPRWHPGQAGRARPGPGRLNLVRRRRGRAAAAIGQLESAAPSRIATSMAARGSAPGSATRCSGPAARWRARRRGTRPGPGRGWRAAGRGGEQRAERRRGGRRRAGAAAGRRPLSASAGWSPTPGSRPAISRTAAAAGARRSTTSAARSRARR